MYTYTIKCNEKIKISIRIRLHTRMTIQFFDKIFVISSSIFVYNLWAFTNETELNIFQYKNKITINN